MFSSSKFIVYKKFQSFNRIVQSLNEKHDGLVDYNTFPTHARTSTKTLFPPPEATLFARLAHPFQARRCCGFSQNSTWRM